LLRVPVCGEEITRSSTVGRRGAIFRGRAISDWDSLSRWTGVANSLQTRAMHCGLRRISAAVVEIDDLAALAKAAIPEKTRLRASCLCEEREVDVPEVGTRIENMTAVRK